MNSTNNREPEITTILRQAKSTGKGKRIKRWIVLSFSIIVTIIAVIFWRSNDHADAPQYKTQEVEYGNLTVTVTATGKVEPTNQVDVGSELSGIIKTVEVDYNARVKAGQVLARLDTAKLEAQVLKSKAALESAQARVRQIQATVRETADMLARLQQVREISGGKVPSQQELDAAEASLKRAQADQASAEAAVSEARATLDANQTDLSKAVILSPVNGVVLVRAVEPGQTVAASLQAPVLFTLAEDLANMELLADVDEADVGQVKKGQDATFTVDAYPERTFSARTTQVRFGSQKVEGVVTYTTVLSVDNSDLSLRPGMTATADIIVFKIDNALLVPNAALRFVPQTMEIKPESVGFIDKLLPRRRRRPASRNGASPKTDIKGRQVWVLSEKDQRKIIPVSVETGHTDGSFTAIVGGPLEKGQHVIVGVERIEK